ncbi:MAG: response regulator [Desulfarculaceae bacterium]|nr:response regulator [Desulfarculaceae bacterium]
MIDLETMSVLIVDDMQSMRRTMRNMFKQLGLGRVIRHAENGEEAWNLIKSTSVDLAVVDWHMPVLNGIELLNRIREDRDLRDMPVIMITAESEKDIVVEVAESEIDAYLLKPLTMKAMDAKVRQVVQNANNPDEVTKCLYKARELEEAENYTEAVEQVRLALTKRPNASRILRKMADLHLKIDKENVAEKCLKKAVAVNKDDAVARYQLGDFYRKKNDLDSANRYFMEAVSISPRAVPQAIELGEQLIRKGKTDQAVKLFDKAIQRSTNSDMSREEIIAIYIQNREYAKARKLLESYLKEQPERYDLMYKLGVAYMKAGDLKNAQDRFQKVDENTEDNIDAKLHLARIYYHQKRVFLADDMINQVLRIDPQNEKALELRKKNM